MNIGGPSRLGLGGANKLTLEGMRIDDGSGAWANGESDDYDVIDYEVKDGPLGMTVGELLPYQKYGEYEAVAIVTKVVKGSQAQGFGAKKGDRVVGVGGKDAISLGNFKAKLKYSEGGLSVKVVRRRKKKKKGEEL